MVFNNVDDRTENPVPDSMEDEKFKFLSVQNHSNMVDTTRVSKFTRRNYDIFSSSLVNVLKMQEAPTFCFAKNCLQLHKTTFPIDHVVLGATDSLFCPFFLQHPKHHLVIKCADKLFDETT